MENKIHIIINPHAGSSNKNRVSIMLKLMNEINMHGDISVSEYRGHINELTTESIKKGYQTIVCLGGDGTINEAASALAGTDIKLGLIPLGSGNGLARHLGIPLNLRKSLEIIKKGRFISIDTMKINQYTSVNISGVGFDAAVAKRFDSIHGRGKWGYIKSIVREFKQFHETEILVSKNQSPFIKINSWVCSFCNSSQYGNNAVINPLSDISDGLIELISLPPIPLLIVPKILYNL